jgi:hypothetical protein
LRGAAAGHGSSGSPPRRSAPGTIGALFERGSLGRSASLESRPRETSS